MRIVSVWLPSLICVVVFGTVLTGCAADAPVLPPGCVAVTAPASGSDRAAVRIELVNGDQVATAVLEDSVAARELLGLLPLSIELQDSFGLAMVGSMPAALDTAGAPTSCAFLVGDVAYSPADGAIAVFHSADAAQLETPGAARLGRVTSGLSTITSPTITAPGRIQVTLRRVG